MSLGPFAYKDNDWQNDAIVGFSDESLMTSIPWDQIEEWFNLRAAAAGYDKYAHSESFDLSYTLAPEIEEATRNMSFNLGRSISDILTKE